MRQRRGVPHLYTYSPTIVGGGFFKHATMCQKNFLGEGVNYGGGPCTVFLPIQSGPPEAHKSVGRSDLEKIFERSRDPPAHPPSAPGGLLGPATAAGTVARRARGRALSPQGRGRRGGAARGARRTTGRRYICGPGRTEGVAGGWAGHLPGQPTLAPSPPEAGSRALPNTVPGPPGY